MSASLPTYVLVGHVTQDVVADGLVVGGATYAGRMALHLGERLGLVTSAADDFDFETALPGALIARVPSPSTSTFENVYIGDLREQYVRAVGARLDAQAIPEAWRGARTLHLAPFTNEVAPGIEELFDASVRAATPQGWLRRWGADGRVHLDGWATLVDRLARLDAVVLSEDDVQRDERTVDMLREALPLLVVTRAARGASLYRRGVGEHFPPFPAREVDPTGAGDAFAAAFFHHLADSGDPAAACTFANCAASFVVEAPGANGVPTLEQIQGRLERGPGG